MRTPETTKRCSGFVGVVMGVLALGMGLMHSWAGPFSPQPSLEEVVADKAVKIRDTVVAKLKGEKKSTVLHVQSFDTDRIISISTVMAGFVAIVLAVVSYIRREDKRITGSAAALGGVALAVQYLAVAIGAIVVAILVAAVLSKLDFDIG